MINIAEVITDPDFAQAYTLTRSSGQFGAGSWMENTPTTVSMYGPIVPTSDEDLQQVPEGDRATGMLTFYSTERIYRTHTDGTPGTSDIITWQGDKWRVIYIKNLSDYGAWKAIAARMTGS